MSLPNSLALQTIADGALEIAADPRNNFAAIQTAVNALISQLGAGVAGQVLGLTPGAVSPIYPPGLEFDYVEKATFVSVTATTGATANTIVTGNAVTYDGSTRVKVEFFAPDIEKGSGSCRLVLYDGSTQLGILGQESAAAGTITCSRFLTPTAVAHTYSIRAYVDAGTGQVGGGDGALGDFMPAYIRITKA